MMVLLLGQFGYPTAPITEAVKTFLENLTYRLSHTSHLHHEDQDPDIFVLFDE